MAGISLGYNDAFTPYFSVVRGAFKDYHKALGRVYDPPGTVTPGKRYSRDDRARMTAAARKRKARARRNLRWVRAGGIQRVAKEGSIT